MGRLASSMALWVATGCVPAYDPSRDAGEEEADAFEECEAPPASFAVLDPWIRESVTGYDHRGGVGDDRGTIHHEAFLVRRSTQNTMLSLQDFYGPDLDRSPGTAYSIEAEFCPSAPCADYSYLGCDLCVLYFEDCPYESMGGCSRQFLAVGGTVIFQEFEKSTSEWNQDGLDALAVRMENLVFREVLIEPTTFVTSQACDAACPPDVPGSGDCFTVASYSFSYDASE